MGRGKLFQREITVSSGVKEKLARKHDLEMPALNDEELADFWEKHEPEESKQSGIDRAQLVRSWVKEKISQLEKR